MVYIILLINIDPMNKIFYTNLENFIDKLQLVSFPFVHGKKLQSNWLDVKALNQCNEGNFMDFLNP